MRFSVKCNHCDHTFIAETQNYGRMKYRCPYCQSVMVCQFDPPKVLKVRARSVIPVAETSPVSSRPRLPEVATRPLAPSVGPSGSPQTATPAQQDTALSSEEQLPKASVHQFKKRAEGFVGLLNWIWCHLSVFCLWSSKRIRKFQSDYEDGDLWIFFAFSFLFIVLVGVGLWTFAEVTSLVSESHSWLFKHYIKMKNLL